MHFCNSFACTFAFPCFKNQYLIETIDPDRITLMLQMETDDRNDDTNNSNGKYDGINDSVNSDLKRNENTVYAKIKKNLSLTAATISNTLEYPSQAPNAR